mmetsp:Transcript_110194/g.216032  ORF Transcript_110194/g.216032 Transcript_110194/m.216032 type:complete len:87 (-) Transcript_110194:1773-2033(-)
MKQTSAEVRVTVTTVPTYPMTPPTPISPPNKNTSIHTSALLPTSHTPSPSPPIFFSIHSFSIFPLKKEKNYLNTCTYVSEYTTESR